VARCKHSENGIDPAQPRLALTVAYLKVTCADIDSSRRRHLRTRSSRSSTTKTPLCLRRRSRTPKSSRWSGGTVNACSTRVVGARCWCPQHRGPFLAKCARNGAPRVIVGARKSEVGDPPEFPCRIHFLRRLRTRVAEIPAKQARLLAVAMAERTLGMLSDHIAYQVLNGDVLALAATFREHLSYRKCLRRLCKPPVRTCLHQTSYIRQCQREKRPTK
jgi:hypothetical protein